MQSCSRQIRSVRRTHARPMRSLHRYSFTLSPVCLSNILCNDRSEIFPTLHSPWMENRILKSLMKVIQHARELSRFTVTGSRHCHCLLGKVSCPLSRDSYENIQSFDPKTHIRFAGGYTGGGLR
jgi:hypothetical protein